MTEPLSVSEEEAIAIPGETGTAVQSDGVVLPTKPHATFAIATAASVAIHAAVLYAVLRQPLRPGASDIPTSAISVNLVRSPIVASAAQAEQQAQAAPNSPVGDARKVLPEPAKTPPDEDRTEAEGETKQRAEEDARLKAEAEAAKATKAEKRAQAAEDEARRKVQIEAELQAEAETAAHQKLEEKKRQKAEAEAKAAEAKRKARAETEDRKASARSRSGARSRSSTARTARNAPASVSASLGQIEDYSARVRAHISQNRPRGSSGGRGTVIAAFGLTASGGLVYARISRSSGDPALDLAVISALHNAVPFPRSPEGIPPGRRQFTMPFYFR